MVKVFRKKSVSAIIFLIILALLTHLHFFFSIPRVVISDDDGFLSYLLRKYISPIDSTYIFILYIVLLIIQSLRLNYVLNDAKMFHQPGFTPAMCYVLLSAFLPQWCSLTPAMVSNSLVIWIFIKLIKLYNNQNPKTLLFNAGLIVGLTILSYHPTAILIIVVLFALTVVRPFRLAEWMVLIIGIITPYYFLFSILYLTGQMNLLYHFIPDMAINLPIQHPDMWFWIDLGLMTFLLLLGLLYWSPSNRRFVIQIRKYWGVMMVMLLIETVIPFIFLNAGVEASFLWMVPLAAFISNFFQNSKKLWFPNLIFWMAMALIIHNNWIFLKIL